MCVCLVYFFFFKQKTAYEMRISDWSSDVCSSDLWVRAATTRSPACPALCRSPFPLQQEKLHDRSHSELAAADRRRFPYAPADRRRRIDVRRGREDRKSVV